MIKQWEKLDKDKSLYEKMKETVPGRHSAVLNSFIYDFSGKDEDRKKLREVFHYLEGLAFEELKKEIPKWVKDLREK